MCISIYKIENASRLLQKAFIFYLDYPFCPKYNQYLCKRNLQAQSDYPLLVIFRLFHILKVRLGQYLFAFASQFELSLFLFAVSVSFSP